MLSESGPAALIAAGVDMPRKRFAQVGLGGRSLMYTAAILEQYADTCELVGLCDLNAGRLALRQRWAAERGVEAPGYLHGDFDRMIAETHARYA